MPDIRDNLKSLIKDKGYKQAAIAHRSELSETQFAAILNKTRRLEANELFAICDALEIDPVILRGYHPAS